MGNSLFNLIFLAFLTLVPSSFISGFASDFIQDNDNLKNEFNKFESPLSRDRVTAFRFRSDFDVDLDEDKGWAAAVNQSVTQSVDVPFRIRFEVESNAESDRRQYSIQYKYNDGPWRYIEAHEFPYESTSTPPISVVGCEALFFGQKADNLIDISKLPADPGAGICLAPTTPGWTPGSETGASVEWEWALVVRYWADGAVQLNADDRFSLRMIDDKGLPLSGPTPEIIVYVPPKHIGGTYVETPARIGPYESDKGELYFIMEPAETDNVFMMIKSNDGGNSWSEIDAKNRPNTVDLEGVGSVVSPDGIIHFVHETSDYVYYHAFATSDFSSKPDQWIVKDQIISKIEKPFVQTADIALRPDGSLVAVYANGTCLQYSIRDPNGTWREPLAIDSGEEIGLTNPSILSRPEGVIEIAYKSSEGKGWSQQLLLDNSLTTAHVFAEDLGTRKHEAIAILPLVYLPNSEELGVFFRKSDGYLYGISKSVDNTWSDPIVVSDRPVVTNAVDSDQAGADVVVHGNEIYVAFIAEDNRDIYLSVMNGFGKTPSIVRLIPDIEGSWVRGNILKSQQNFPYYGIIYDAGSMGGSGFNRFYQYPIVALD